MDTPDVSQLSISETEVADGKRRLASPLNHIDPHAPPPSKVLHVRAIPDEADSEDLKAALAAFGTAVYVTMVPRLRQALVEMETVDQAVFVVTQTAANPLSIRGRVVYFNYSRSQDINRATANGAEESAVLLFTVVNPLYPVTTDILFSICSPYGSVLRIVIFRKHNVQCLVEFDKVAAATAAKNALSGAEIYPGCCHLKVEYSRCERLNVRHNNLETRDYTNPTLPHGPIASPTVSPGGGLWGGGNALYVTPSPRAGLSPGSVGAASGPWSSTPRAAPQSVPSIAAPQWSVSPGSRLPPAQMSLLAGSLSPASGGLQSPYGVMPPSPSLQAASPVLMVYGINKARLNCTHLFNLFCLYGNVVKIKFLPNKDNTAMVHMSDHSMAVMAMTNLNMLTVADGTIEVGFSKFTFIAGTTTGPPLPDGTDSCVDFSTSPRNRYLRPNPNATKHMHKPSAVLHFFNAPLSATPESVKAVFAAAGDAPIHLKFFDKGNTDKSWRGLVEFASIQGAANALAFCNNTAMPSATTAAGTQELKLAFSGAPTAA